MEDSKRIEIPLSKGKLIIILIVSIIFVSIGFWFIVRPPLFNNSIFDIPTMLWVSGVSSILFFGFCGVVVVKKLNDKKPGLVIDKTGITDNSTAIAAGHIPWVDIEEIKLVKVFTQQFIIIKVQNPQKYISRQTKSALKKAVEYNYKNYGSPITISEVALKYNFKELETILQNEFKKYRGK